MLAEGDFSCLVVPSIERREGCTRAPRVATVGVGRGPRVIGRSMGMGRPGWRTDRAPLLLLEGSAARCSGGDVSTPAGEVDAAHPAPSGGPLKWPPRRLGKIPPAGGGQKGRGRESAGLATLDPSGRSRVNSPLRAPRNAHRQGGPPVGKRGKTSLGVRGPLWR